MTLGASQVIEWAKELEDDQEHKAYRDLMLNREALVAMRLPAQLTKRIVDTGDISEMRSPSLMSLALIKRSKWLTFDTHITVFNRDGQTQDHKAEADNLEKLLVVCLGQLNEGNRWFNEDYWHLLLSSYAVPILHCGDDDIEDDYSFPWRIETPDPSTCFFTVQAGPFRPPVLARRYTITVAEAEKWYSGKAKGPLEGKQLRREGKKWLVFGDDHQAEASGLSIHRSGKGPTEVIEVIRLYDGKNQYHIVKSEKDGMEPSADDRLVWAGEERTGGVPAVVLSGVTLPNRTPGERLSPLYWPGYRYLDGLNEMRSRRMTMADRLTHPDVAVELANPGMIEDSLAGVPGQSGSTRRIAFKPGEWTEVNGQLVPIPGGINEDLDKAVIDWTEEYREWRQAHQDIDDPELFSRATVNVQLQQVQARGRLDTEPIGNKDWAVKTILEMLLTSLKTYKGREFKMVTSRDLRYGERKKVAQGQPYTLAAKDVNFDYVVKVATEQITEQERTLRTDIAWANYAEKGVGTFEQVLDTLYDDPGEQWEKLAIDAAQGVLAATTFSEMQLQQIAEDLAWLEGGYPLAQLRQEQQQEAWVAGGVPGQAGGTLSATGNAPPGANGSVPRAPTMQAPVVPGSSEGEVGTGIS